ncbi:MAG: hypothetical protein D6741_05760 [Planctomycetota bacterium]|nr:MAG: hypothetical protein D6741_05760 [Planctomycetota bacterium]
MFEFYCPNDHLLEAEPDEAGTQARCPICNAEFVIPSPPDVSGSAPATPAGAPPPAVETEPPSDPHADAWSDQPPAFQQETPVIHDAPGVAPAADELLHIRCPQGHILETPRDMLGQDAMCPHCGAVLRLRYESTEEYRAKRREEIERRERRRAQMWLQWAIFAAVFVVGGVLTLIVLAFARGR